MNREDSGIAGVRALCYHRFPVQAVAVAKVISDELRQRLHDQELLVLTGAGVRLNRACQRFGLADKRRVWKGMPFDVILYGAKLEKDLPAVWEWFNYRRGVLRALKPNAAHEAIAGWQDRFEQFTLVTQNVDGLHGLAGSRDVIEIHGSVWRARCLGCHARISLRESDHQDGVPACLECGSSMRPDVVLFGEMLPAGAFENAATRAAACDLCFVVGTSAVVYPAAAIPEIAREAGAYVVEAIRNDAAVRHL